MRSASRLLMCFIVAALLLLHTSASFHGTTHHIIQNIMTTRQKRKHQEQQLSLMSPLMLIPPPESSPEENDKRALQLLKKLGKVLFTRSSTKCYDKHIIKENNHGSNITQEESVRPIQTGRLEVFVANAADKCSTCLDEILQHNQFPNDAKDEIVQYAIRQASRDTRIILSSEQFKFGNFSLILTFGACDKQDAHIDLLAPNYQFGLIVTDSSPGTFVYVCKDDIVSVQDLEELWNEWSDQVEKFPKNLTSAIHQSTRVMNLLRDYGNTLLPESKLTEIGTDDDDSLLPTGSLLSLPGSVLHAGPAAHDNRAVLFFSASPNDNTVAEYHPDTQYTGTFLCGQLTFLLWRSPGIGLVEREYLLRMVVKYIQDASVKREWADHFAAGGFRSFVQAVEENRSNPTYMEKLIQSTARKEDLCFYNTDEFDIVSVDGLTTVWNDQQEQGEFLVRVHCRHSDSKILLEYPTDNNDESSSSSSWEGGKPGNKYTLQLEHPGELFNGNNGTLRATDGEEIHCRCPM